MTTAFKLHVNGQEEALALATNKGKAKVVIVLQKGKTTNLVADQFEPAGIADKTLVWKSLSTKVATVNNGKIKGVSKGTVVIQVSPKNNSKLIYYFKVTVK